MMSIKETKIYHQHCSLFLFANPFLILIKHFTLWMLSFLIELVLYWQ